MQVNTLLNFRTCFPVGAAIAQIPAGTRLMLTGTGQSATVGGVSYFFVPSVFNEQAGCFASEFATIIGTATPTLSPTSSPTRTSTPTGTATRTATGSPSPTSTQPTSTPTSTRTPTLTPTRTATSAAPSATPTRTPTRTATPPSGLFAGVVMQVNTLVNFRTCFPVGGAIAQIPAGTRVVLTGTGQSATVGGVSYFFVPSVFNGQAGCFASEFATVIGTATPTRTATATGAAGTSTPTRTPTRTSTPGGGFSIGSTVEPITGLNLRVNHGTEYTIIDVLPAGIDCTVLAGPIPEDGYTWYQVSCPGFPNGWVAGEYLVQVTGASLAEEEAAPGQTEAETAVPTLTQTLPAEAVEPTVAVEEAVDTPLVEPTAETIPTQVVLPTETGPQPYPIVRVQRTAGTANGRVLVDQLPETVWSTDGSEVPRLAAFILDLGEVYPVSTLRWLSDPGGMAGTLRIDVSVDNQTWSELEIGELAAAGAWQELVIGGEVRYIRFVFINDQGLGIVGGIAEVEVWP